MTVVGLHPEELFDKLLDGELMPPERERLRQHLDSCSVCRFEHATRLDFLAEALELARASPPPALPLRVPLPLAETPVTGTLPVVQASQAAAARRRRSRRMIWGLAAAALITTSGAVASGLASGTEWYGFGSLFTLSAAPAPQPVVRPAVPTKAPVAVAPQQAPVPIRAPSPAAEALPAVETAPTRALESRPATTHGSSPRVHATAASVAAPTVLSGVTRTETPNANDSPAKELAAAKEPSSAAKLFGEANQARRSGDIGRASGLYHLLQDQFPGSPEADLSRITLAMLLLDNGDPQGALSGFERYLAGSSRGLEAEALVGRARALGCLGRRDLEGSAWQEVQRKYPRSIYGRQATERLLALGQP